MNRFTRLCPEGEPTPFLREPGQVVSEDYRRHGRLRYDAQQGEIVGRNGLYYGNRPLYCARETDGVVLAGDRPAVRLIAHAYVMGFFCAGIIRSGQGVWWHDLASIEQRYRCGRMAWFLSDPAWNGANVLLEAVPMDGAAGMVLRAQMEGFQENDRLVWSFGGARKHENGGAFGFWLETTREQWDPVYRGNPNVCKTGDPRKPELSLGLIPEWSHNNRFLLRHEGFELWPEPQAPFKIIGRCDGDSRYRLGDAATADRPAHLIDSTPDTRPLLTGEISLAAGIRSIHWAFEVVSSQTPFESAATGCPALAFTQAQNYLSALEQVVRVETPEPRLDAAVSAVAHAMDGACDRHAPLFRHGCMAWSIPFLGWRVIGGATAWGRHDCVKANAAYYLPRQVTDTVQGAAEADPTRGNAIQSGRSRFWGLGRLAPDDSHFYNTQSQFFDQLIREWRWTGDRELETQLRPALERHLEWARDCFDPDGDGLYESYINTLPTDSVWYGGGGSVEESAYAFTGHRAARDMARRAGDLAASDRHQQHMDVIRLALRTRLWNFERGHFDSYIEQGGLQRRHEDAWVYSQFLPIDAGLVPPENAIQALYYTEWALERIPLPFGGELCQPSNWVPSKWSVRDMFGGDLWHLALAYAQTGLADEGWQLFLGALLESAYASAVPGGFSQIGAGTDFADNSHMFARAVVEGLFGFDPDYPAGVVHVHPAFPSAWPSAFIQTPDFSLRYETRENQDHYRLTLAQPARVEFKLPVRSRQIGGVTLNGQPASWTVALGFGCSLVTVHTEPGNDFILQIDIAQRVPQSDPIRLEGKVGALVRLVIPDGTPTGLRDLHGVLRDEKIDAHSISARLDNRPGHYLVLVDARRDTLPLWQIIKLRIVDPEGDAQRAALSPRWVPEKAVWQCLDLNARLNGDIRAIFKQTYRANRPNTCSVRLATDGYSAWTMKFWGDQPPEINLDNVPRLSDELGRITASNGAPFIIANGPHNVAFTSRWDNWPPAITIPIGTAADVIYFLVCGFTSPMQTRIANAELRLRYADGQTDALELVPPLNFWSLCPWGGIDYNYETDAFCLPAKPPPQAQLGANCRAIVVSRALRPGINLTEVTLECLSDEVVIGLMGISLMNYPIGEKR